jgi:SAM-dependent methyltransferase
MTEDDAAILKKVRDQYAAVASSDLSNDSSAVRTVAAAFGYSAEQLASLPPEANMGLSCGNPLALASLRTGETVVDLGCGGGMDVFLAANQVGPTGRAIGIDMTSEMLSRAQDGAKKVGATNVEFHQSKIDALPLADNSVDCIISNCVINLVPEKDAVFREMLRVLKPGGRVAISDIALKRRLPDDIKANVEAYVGCIAGAIHIEDYRRQLHDAGFVSVVVTDTGADLNAYAQAAELGAACCGGGSEQAGTNDVSSISCCHSLENETKTLHAQLADVLSHFNANEYAASVRVHAVKDSFSQNSKLRKSAMAKVQVYDKPMCCSTGVCGPQVDPVLPRFAADLKWLSDQGHEVQRFNLAQQPGEFANNSAVQQVLSSEGVDCLPLVVVNGNVVSRSEYPSRENLALWADTELKQADFPGDSDPDVCCGDSDCC